jgi:hypothetical protein
MAGNIMAVNGLPSEEETSETIMLRSSNSPRASILTS